MVTTIKNIIETLIFPDGTRHTLFPLQSPFCHPLREAGVSVGGISEAPEGYSIERRGADSHEILFTLAGSGQLIVADKMAPAAPNDIMVLPAKSQYRYQTREAPWRILWFHVFGQCTWLDLTDVPPHVRPGAVIDDIRRAAEGLMVECIRTDHASPRLLALFAEQIVLYLKREMLAADSTSNRRLREFLHDLWTDVNAHLEHAWTVAAMANRLNMSPAHFHRICLRYAGCSPMRMLFRLRMQRAEELLLEYTDHPLKLIADSVGYGTPFAFSNAFKRYKGISPKRYRAAYARAFPPPTVSEQHCEKT